MTTEKKRALILVADGFQDEEVTVPLEFLRDHGVEVVLAGPKAGSVSGKYGRATVDVPLEISAVEPDGYDLLLLPGGAAPEILRLDEDVLTLTRAFMERPNRVVAAICHGPQVLISAGVLRGRTLTCYAGIRYDVRLAGARTVDKNVVTEGRLITSRKPEDLPAFLEAIGRALGLQAEADEPEETVPAKESVKARDEAAVPSPENH